MYLSSQYSISVTESSEEEIGLLGQQNGGSYFALNDVPTYGLYNRNDFMQRCYKRCKKLNDKHGKDLKKLLCVGGESSKSGDFCSTLFFAMVFIIPLITLALLLPAKKLSMETKLTIVSCCLVFLFALAIWHCYSIYVIVQNKKKWLSSWFTCEVTKAMIPSLMPIKTGGSGDRFFDIRHNMMYLDVTKESIPNTPVLSDEQKKSILHTFAKLNIGRARIILYTKKFMHTVSDVPKNFSIILLCVTVVCLCVMTLELLLLLGVFS